MKETPHIYRAPDIESGDKDSQRYEGNACRIDVRALHASPSDPTRLLPLAWTRAPVLQLAGLSHRAFRSLGHLVDLTVL